MSKYSQETELSDSPGTAVFEIIYDTCSAGVEDVTALCLHSGMNCDMGD